MLVLVLNGHTLLHVNESSSLAIRSTIEEVIALQIFAFIYKIFLFFNHLQTTLIFEKMSLQIHARHLPEKRYSTFDRTGSGLLVKVARY